MRRFALRALRDDEGFGLIETVVSLLVFSLIMTGLAASMVLFAHNTTLAKARASATTIAQQYTEKARAVGGTLLENCDNTTTNTPYPPSTAPYRGDSGHTVVQGHTGNCIPYQKPVPQDGISFTLTRLVLLKGTATDISGQPINEKYLVVTVSWSDIGGSTKSYELDTVFNQKGTITAAPAQGIRFVIKDIAGNILTADGSTWGVSITSATLCSSNPGNLCTSPDAVTAEGTYNQVDLAPGNYTCTAWTTNDASGSYYAGGQPTYNNITGYTLSSSTGGTGASSMDTISGPCSVSPNTVNDFSTTWQSGTDCATSATSTGTVNFTVTDANNTPLNAMAVKLTQLSDSTKFYSKNTNTSGVASGLKPVANWYTYTVTDSGGNFVTANAVSSPICIVAGTTYNLTVKMNAVGGCSTVGSQATVNFTVQDASTHAGLNGYKPFLYDASSFASTGFPATNTVGGVVGYSTKNTIAPGLYYYLAGLPGGASTYGGSGLLGPICIVSGETRNLTVGLSAATSCTRHTSQNAFVTTTVTDMAGAPVTGATIGLVNMNGDGSYSVATDGNGKPNQSNGGVKSIKVTDVGPYQYVVVGPDGNYLTSDILGPVCTTQNVTSTVPNVALQGLFNVNVTVRNNDALAWKTYQISIIDSTGKTQQTQSVSVPNCGSCSGNPSASIPLTGIKTGSYYIQVCAQIKTNCSVVDTAPGQTPGTVTYYQFLTPGTTYTAAGPPTGYSELTTVDDSGGA